MMEDTHVSPTPPEAPLATKQPLSPRGAWLSHPLTNLVLGFVLTGIVGSLIASGIQRRAEETRRREEVRETRRAAAVRTFEDVTAVLNEGSALYSDAVWALLVARASITPEPEFYLMFGHDIQHVRAEARRYAGLVGEFGTRLDGREIVDNARVCISFGEKLSNEHARIALHFNACRQSLESLNRLDVVPWLSDSITTVIQNDVYDLRHEVHAFAVDMANAIATGKVEEPADASGGPGYFGEARCKTIPEFTQPPRGRPKR